jgi:antitoxin component YwqK of YwqJK toxin-antitoxin module
MKNGQFHGIWQSWYKDGRRGLFRQYKNNQGNGPIIIFIYAKRPWRKRIQNVSSDMHRVFAKTCNFSGILITKGYKYNSSLILFEQCKKDISHGIFLLI